jgi:DNA-binding MurR/RpiR family transcriptional regulator
LEKARAFSGLISKKLKSLAAATRAMGVHRLEQLVESLPNAPRTIYIFFSNGKAGNH